MLPVTIATAGTLRPTSRVQTAVMLIERISRLCKTRLFEKLQATRREKDGEYGVFVLGL